MSTLPFAMSSKTVTCNAKKKLDLAQRAEIIGRLGQLAKDFAGPAPLVEHNLNGHQFKVNLCVGKSGSFYNIGRYYQVVRTFQKHFLEFTSSSAL